MKFIDEIELRLKAGDGGDGVVRWRREKYVPKGGPAGGNGGKGGDFYVSGSRDVNLLSRYLNKKEILAEDGAHGGGRSMHGKNGKDEVMEVPVGTVVHNKSIGKSVEVLEEGEKILILKGGKGGLGNEHFKGAENQQPQEKTPGVKGEEGDFLLELKLVVDFGFVGFPNAGKSSLLNSLTNASAKVGSYEFTTLYPNLGDMYGYIVADIPGLIEGASEGKGLGHRFLRHISRTKMLLHCISLENDDLEERYEAIRKELSSYDQLLTKKQEVIILTKKDEADEQKVTEMLSIFGEKSEHVYAVSVLDDASVKELRDVLVHLASEYKEDE